MLRIGGGVIDLGLVVSSILFCSSWISCLSNPGKGVIITSEGGGRSERVETLVDALGKYFAHSRRLKDSLSSLLTLLQNQVGERSSVVEVEESP